MKRAGRRNFYDPLAEEEEYNPLLVIDEEEEERSFMEMLRYKEFKLPNFFPRSMENRKLARRPEDDCVVDKVREIPEALEDCPKHMRLKMFPGVQPIKNEEQDNIIDDGTDQVPIKDAIPTENVVRKNEKDAGVEKTESGKPEKDDFKLTSMVFKASKLMKKKMLDRNPSHEVPPKEEPNDTVQEENVIPDEQKNESPLVKDQGHKSVLNVSHMWDSKSKTHEPSTEPENEAMGNKNVEGKDHKNKEGDEEKETVTDNSSGIKNSPAVHKIR